jgi:small-conductance mechanosensitive channel
MKNSTEVGRLLTDLFDDLQNGAFLWQIAVIALALLAAWQVSRYVRRRLNAKVIVGEPDRTMRISVGGMNRELFPVTALLLLLVGRWALEFHNPVHLLNIAVPLMLAMVIIRGVVYLLRHTFAPGGMLRSWEVTISWLVWLGVALHIAGLLPAITRFLEDTAFRVGQQRLSLAVVLTAALTVILTVLAALWVGRMLDSRIMAMQHVEINLRFALTKILRTILVVVAVLIALPIVGIDITVLSVFGGALGVGIGLGLQKIASNYVSGFTILLDRTVSPGDLVTVDNFYGEVTKLAARCIIVRSPDGTEAIVPNETLVTSTVINHSYSNRRVLVKVPVQISYSSDLEKALELMVREARSHVRVLKDPGPVGLLTSFGDNGINLEVVAWIEDPERGKGNLQSDLNLAIFRAFTANKIEIPFPQRDIRIVGGLNPGEIAPK